MIAAHSRKPMNVGNLLRRWSLRRTVLTLMILDLLLAVFQMDNAVHVNDESIRLKIFMLLISKTVIMFLLVAIAATTLEKEGR